METPSFSIVIPTYNRPERLADCLQALVKLDYPRDRYEVIVVDDGSAMDLRPAVAAVEDQLSVQLLRQANQGPAAARNAGAEKSTGQFVAFTDDDCAPMASWLSELAQQFAKTPEAMVGGYSVNALDENLYSTASQQLIDYLYSYYNEDEGSISFFASNNIALPRQSFIDIGGFDVSFPLAAAEDREFCDRWLYKGRSMVYAPQVQILHSHHLSLRTFWKQHFGYGRGAYCFHQIRAHRDVAPIEVEPLTFYSNLLLYPLKHPSQHQGMVVSALLFVSQCATVAGFFRERWLAPA